jgi:Protein of unknown function (DUF4038)/Putative collagen-binding domain of a collagenase
VASMQNMVAVEFAALRTFTLAVVCILCPMAILVDAGGGAGQSIGGGGTSTPTPALTPPPASGPVTWPLRISMDGKYLEDSAGVPFQLAAEAGWELTTQISDQDAITYLDDRLAKGFNAIEIRVIGSAFQSNAPNNFYNESPFTLGPTNWSVRNEAYWSRVDKILLEMRKRGMLAVMFPAYLGAGCGREGWCQQMIAQSNATMTDYGHWIGSRYRDYGNILWMTGGDFDPVRNAAASARNNAVLAGIRRVVTNALFSAEPSPNQIAGIDAFQGLLDVNSVYAYGNAVLLARRAYQNPRPFMLQEGTYENEHNSTIVHQQALALITVLGGGLAGQTFGSCPLWSFANQPGWCNGRTAPFNTWQSNMNSPGSVSLGNIGKLMRSRKWWTLVPDYSNAVVTSPKGTGETGYHATARETTGKTVMVWAPDTSQISVDMTKVGGSSAHAWWYNPDNNTAVDIGTFTTAGVRNFTPSSARKVLVIDDAGLNYAAPGTTVYRETPNPASTKSDR